MRRIPPKDMYLPLKKKRRSSKSGTGKTLRGHAAEAGTLTGATARTGALTGAKEGARQVVC